MSLDPLSSPRLTETAVAASPATAPDPVHFYALSGALPRLAVEPAGEARLLRDGYAPGWTALVDGRPVPLREHRGRHREVAIPAGRNVVTMRYRPPGWRPSLAIAGTTLLALGLLAGWRVRASGG